jgi:ferric-dicitrate binding protein FerR (iron transport regulator)
MAMTRKSCEEIGEQLHAYRAGELGPLERERVEAHLNHCADCAAELAMMSSLVDAARLGPPAMSWDQKKRIELQLFEHLATPQKQQQERRTWRWWPVIFIPSFAAGAALMALLFTLIPKETSVAVASGWLPTESGVRAFAPSAAEVNFDVENKAPHLTLKDKAVLVRYQRPVDAGILSVSTPHGEVLVKGTVFFVDVDKDKSIIGVQRGVVEVIAHDGSTVAVLPGQQFELSESGVAAVEARSPHFDMLDVLFPKPIELEPIEDAPKLRRRVDVPADPGPDSKAIAAVVQKRQWLIQECYQHALKRDPSLGGAFEVELVISTSGEVTDLNVTVDELGSELVANCVRERMHKWTFPAHPSEEMTISVPFVFNRTPYKPAK